MPEIGSLLAEKPRLPPTAVFYLIYAAALVWFAVIPSIGLGWQRGS